MRYIHYFWIDNKDELNVIERILSDNNITYDIKIEKIKVSIKNKIHQTKEDVFIILIDELEIEKADKVLSLNKEYHLIPCYSKKIVKIAPSIVKERKAKDLMKSLLLLGIILIFTFFPVDIIKNNIMITLIQLSKIVLFIFLAFYSAKKDFIGFTFLIFVEGIIALIYSYVDFRKNAIESVNILGSMIYKFNFFLFILCIIITLLIGTFYGVRNYDNRGFIEKVKFCILIAIGYFFVMIFTIVGYSNLFAGYHNNLYYKYEDLLSTVSYTVDRDKDICRKETEENIKNGRIVIEGYYNKERESEEVDFQPYKIILSKYDNEDNPREIIIIEPIVNTILEEEYMGTKLSFEFIYFSSVTYFTLGYGDIYPVTGIAKMWVIQESFIAHILSLFVVPTLIVAGQLFVSKEGNVDRRKE